MFLNSFTNVIIKKLNCESFCLLGSFRLETIQLNDASFQSTSKESFSLSEIFVKGESLKNYIYLYNNVFLYNNLEREIN